MNDPDCEFCQEDVHTAMSMLLSEHAAGLVTSAADVADVLSLDLSLRERTTLDWYMGKPADAEGMLYILHYGGIVDD